MPCTICGLDIDSSTIQEHTMSAHMNQMNGEMAKGVKDMNDRFGTMYDLVHSIASSVNIVENEIALLKSQNASGSPQEIFSDTSVKPKDKKKISKGEK